jgi:hypothetical protein
MPACRRRRRPSVRRIEVLAVVFRHPGESRDPAFVVIPAQAGIHVVLLSILDHQDKIKMGPGFRREDEHQIAQRQCHGSYTMPCGLSRG